jgi:hypothetical protein
LPGKALDLTVWKRHKVIALEEVEDALSQKIHDNADMAPVIEAVSKMNTSIPVLGIIRFQG